MNGGADKPLVLVHAEIKTPPLSTDARRRVGFLLRRLQRGLSVSMPDSRPMPSIGPRCHELRVNDPGARQSWRIIYRLDPDAVVVVEVFSKRTRATPHEVIHRCRQRLVQYDNDRRG
jgi:phage-related protein